MSIQAMQRTRESVLPYGCRIGCERLNAGVSRLKAESVCVPSLCAI
jgi:hypothetical protein